MTHPQPALLAPPPLPVPPQASDEDLRLFAEFLAREAGFDAVAAGLHGPSWYRDRVGEDICTLERAAVLRLLVVDLCDTKAARHPFLVNPYRDVSQQGGRDAPANRARRAALMAQLPGRVEAGVVDLQAAADVEFERAVASFDQERARAEFERRMEWERADEEEYGGGVPHPVFWAFLLLLLAAAAAGVWHGARAVIR